MAKRPKWFVYAPASEPGVAFISKMSSARRYMNNSNFVVYAVDVPTKKAAHAMSRNIRVSNGYR